MSSPMNAIEVAALVKLLPNLEQAAALIEQYAATVAAGARLEEAAQIWNRIDAVLDNFKVRPEARPVIDAELDRITFYREMP